MSNEIPEGATHKRDIDSFYRVTDKVQYYEHCEWCDVKDCYDLEGWLEELTPLVDIDLETKALISVYLWNIFN
jgi:hypothetical protein